MLRAITSIVVYKAMKEVLRIVVHLARGGTAKHHTSIEEDQRLAGFTVYLMPHYPRSVEQGGDIYIVPSGI